MLKDLRFVSISHEKHWQYGLLEVIFTPCSFQCDYSHGTASPTTARPESQRSPNSDTRIQARTPPSSIISCHSRDIQKVETTQNRSTWEVKTHAKTLPYTNNLFLISAANVAWSKNLHTGKHARKSVKLKSQTWCVKWSTWETFSFNG